MSFESDYNKKVKPLLARLNAKEAQLKKLLLASLKNPSTSLSSWNRLRREVDILYAQMATIFGNWAKKEIPSAYKQSIRSITAKINSMKSITATPAKSINQMLFSKNTDLMTTMMWQEAASTYLSALNAGRSNVIRFTRVTQQVLLSEAEINLSLASSLSQAQDLGKAARVLTGEFYGKMLDGINSEHFIQAGRYKYKPSYYAQMVSRVKFHEAQSLSALATANNYDTDLIQVSSHNTRTAICIPFEGKIYSISGKDKRFPILEDTSPYHPNCLHLMFPVFVSALEQQGALDEFSDFSKGKIDSPPFPKSFVPTDQRKVV